jgi:N-acetylglutamate synthase/N-acetylornithine aminotransferase
MTPVRAEAEKNTKGAAAKNKRFIVPGFLAAAVSAEVKKGKIRPDLGLIVSEVPAVVAGVFTRNLVKAAPIQINLKNILQNQGRAILVNSGNANACTGSGGLRDAQKLSQRIALDLSIPDEQVFPGLHRGDRPTIADKPHAEGPPFPDSRFVSSGPPGCS